MDDLLMGVHGPAHAALARGRAALDHPAGASLRGPFDSAHAQGAAAGTPTAAGTAAGGSSEMGSPTLRPLRAGLRPGHSRSLSSATDMDLSSFTFASSAGGLLQPTRSPSVSAGMAGQGAAAAAPLAASAQAAGPGPGDGAGGSPAVGGAGDAQQELAVLSFGMTKPHSKQYKVSSIIHACSPCHGLCQQHDKE